MNDEIIVGRHAVEEALSPAGPLPEKVFIARTASGGPIHRIVARCKELRIPFSFVDAAQLGAMAGAAHQGVAARTGLRQYCELDELIGLARAAAHSCICMVDELEDPHNLGAIIRSAMAFGVQGIVITKHRSAGITQGVMKSSAGTAGRMPVSRVHNLVQAMDSLKEAGFWIAGADMQGASVLDTAFSFPLALVVGNEHRGLRQLVRRHCDYLVSVPFDRGRVESLNASVAAGILLYCIAAAAAKP